MGETRLFEVDNLREAEESQLASGTLDSATLLPSERLEGVVIGVLVGLRDSGAPLVAFPGNLRSECLEARTTVSLTHEDVGRQMALLFEGGDPARPLVIGRIDHPGSHLEPAAKPTTSVTLEGESLVLSAERDIVLRCGKASITLTRAGKILIRGAYILSRSSGANRIKGGSVQVN